MKKKLTMMLSVALIAVMAICGTLAYLTSTDSDVNVMTTGNVEIKQNEQQRVEKEGEFSSELEDFEQGKILMPYTSRDGKKDTYTVGTHQVNKSDTVNNYVDKIVSVTNTGSEDAYVRTLLAIPTGGADWVDTPAAANDAWLHWNTTVAMNSHWYSQWATQEGHTYAGVFAEIDGQGYYVWEFTHKTAIEPEYTTFPTLLGTYMDNRVNHDDKGYYMDINSNLKYDDGDKRIEDIEVGSTVDILVLSQAVQADGFADAQTALDEVFGEVTEEKAVEWFGGMTTTNVASVFSEAGTYNVTKAIVFEDEAGDNIVASAAGVIVNVNGGYYDAGSQRNNCAVWAKDGGTININDGTFIADGDAAPATSASHLDLIYAGQSGTINIYGGTFSLRNNNGWLLNEKDNSATITVYGGSFLNWNPADNESEGANTNFLAEGYTVEKENTSEGIWYHVVPGTNE